MGRATSHSYADKAPSLRRAQIHLAVDGGVRHTSLKEAGWFFTTRQLRNGPTQAT